MVSLTRAEIFMKLIQRITIAFCLSFLLGLNLPFAALAEGIFPNLSGADLQQKIAENGSPEATLGCHSFFLL